MVIAIDGYEANVNQRVGIGRYAYEILKGIYELEIKHEFRIYLPSPPLPDMPKETAWWQYRIVPLPRFWTFLGLPLALVWDRPKPDVVFSPTHYAPRLVSIPRVIALMDLSFLRYPEMFRTRDLLQLTAGTAFSVRRAAKILTISNYSKDDIIKTYRVPGERVIVTYPGITMDKSSKLKAPISNILRKYHLSRHYILAVGTLQPRKNYALLVEAFSRFLQQNKQKFGQLQLVIVGKRGWLYEEILRSPSRFGVAERVKFLDFVDEADLPALYQGALCFVLPSLYEGFGLPVLEAMAYGCPVVVSDRSSLPEIAGKAGIYVNPQSVESITQGLLTAVRERNLIQGRSRIKFGLDQAKKFSWEKAARQTLKVIEQVAV